MTKMLSVKRTESWGPSKIRKDSKKRSDNRMGVSGRESWPALSCGLHNCTNPSLRFQFLPLISELVLPTHMVRCDQIYCPETAPFLTAFTYLSRCEITNVAWKNVKAGVSDKTMCFGWTDSLHFCVCPYPVWSRGSLWWRKRTGDQKELQLVSTSFKYIFLWTIYSKGLGMLYLHVCLSTNPCLYLKYFFWNESQKRNLAIAGTF